MDEDGSEYLKSAYLAPIAQHHIPVAYTPRPMGVGYFGNISAFTAASTSFTTINSVPIVVLCGSTRFIDLFDKTSLLFTLQGWIVLSVG